MKTQAWLVPFCAQLSVSVVDSDLMNKAIVCGKSVDNKSHSNLSCFPFIKSKPVWLGSEGLKFVAIKYFCGLIMNRTIWSLQMGIFAHFLLF